uniref:Nuclear pore complex protein 205kDa n=1 Tax=Triatoma infestans TaxID=30076 RepID=A0A161MI82_TRIIF
MLTEYNRAAFYKSEIKFVFCQMCNLHKIILYF